jgi:NAD(P)H-hydrate repair Nnr-like enzyme with NAD(P)H-hydrate epimerase domain
VSKNLVWASHKVSTFPRKCDDNSIGGLSSNSSRLKSTVTFGLRFPYNMRVKHSWRWVLASFGYGLSAAPHGASAQLIEWANNLHKAILALDLPSGLDATTEEAPGDIVKATETLTLALPKA